MFMGRDTPTLWKLEVTNAMLEWLLESLMALDKVTCCECKAQPQMKDE
jgi:hypothetical protein